MIPYLRIHIDSHVRRMGTGQIVCLLEEQIRSAPSDQSYRLPPIRVLAHQLGVSKNTVAVAYDELRSKDLIESRDRRGIYVMRKPDLTSVPKIVKVPVPKLKTLPSGLGTVAHERKSKVVLGTVFIDPNLLPKDKIEACFRSVLRSPGISNFAEEQGYRPLREKIAERLRARGMEAHADHIITTVGSQQVLDIVSRVLIADTVATENPAYYLGKTLFEFNGKKLIGLPLKLFEPINFSEWRSIIEKNKPGLLYLISNFQNPTGYSYSSQELAQILKWSQEFGFGILEDDWGSDMMPFSEFRPSLRAMGGDAVLYMNSFTKKVLPSLRVGYVLGNEQTTPALRASKRLSTSGSPGIIEAALFEFLDRGYFDAHLKNLQKEMERRYRIVLELLATHMPEEVKWTTPGGGPVLWLECPRKVDLQRLVQDLDKKKILLQLSTGAFFGMPHLHGFKVAYGFHSPIEMEYAIEHLAAEIKKQMSGL